MGNLMKRATAFILTAALAFSLLSQTTAFAASKKNYVTRGYVLQQIELSHNSVLLSPKMCFISRNILLIGIY